MEGHDVDKAGAPVIERVGAKIAALERRAEYLERQLDDWRGSPGGKDFARSELAGIRGGIAALRFHRAEIEGLDQPLLALEELVDAVTQVRIKSPADAAVKAANASIERARKVLEDWS